MPNRVALGLGGLEADPGDHICGVISGEEERNQILIPFLQVGLASGDKCICVIDGTSPDEIVTPLGPKGDAAARTTGKQLEVIGASDIYLRSGRFSAGEVIASWKAAMSDAMYAGQFDVAAQRLVQADLDDEQRFPRTPNGCEKCPLLVNEWVHLRLCVTCGTWAAATLPRSSPARCDLLVVGSGPGGMSAAVYGASEGLRTMVLYGTATGGP